MTPIQPIRDFLSRLHSGDTTLESDEHIDLEVVNVWQY